MGRGVLLTETRYSTARRLAREAEERCAEEFAAHTETRAALARVDRSLGAACDELHGTTVANQRLREVLEVTEREAAAVPYLMDMIAEMAPIVEAARNAVANAVIIPDPAMAGATDIAAVPLDDIETMKEVDKTK